MGELRRAVSKARAERPEMLRVFLSGSLVRGNWIPTISLCMIVRDEERFLRPCLESVRGVVDEI